MQTLPDNKTQKVTASSIMPQDIDYPSLFYNKILLSWQQIAFWLIMALAAFLRLYQFPNTPAGVWVDEATEGYDAFALLQHGTDRWGNPFPIYFPGWGSGQNVLQAYLSIPFIKLFGLNVFSIRIVPVSLGILAVYLLYLVVKKVYGTNTALLSAFLLATLPWDVMASRWGLESNLLPFFLLLSISTLIYAYDSPRRRRWIPISLIPMAISFYAYGMAIIPIFGFLALFCIFNYKLILKEKVRFLMSVFLFLLLSWPFLLFFLENYILHRPLLFLSHLPFTIPYLPSNRLNQIDFGLSKSTILLDNLRFIIGGYHDEYLLNSIPWISPLGWLVPPFTVLGIYFSLKRQKLSQNHFVFWMVATLPALIVVLLNVHHANALYIPIIVLGAYGIVSLLESVQPVKTQTIVSFLLIGSLFFPNIIFYQYYFGAYNNDNAASFDAGYDQALAHAISASHAHENIYIHISDDWTNYAETLFYLQSDAEDFHSHANIQLVDGVYQVNNYGRYYFAPAPPPPALTNASSYIAILHGNYQVSCQHKEILYQNNRWPGGQWTVERCFPPHTLSGKMKNADVSFVILKPRYGIRKDRSLVNNRVSLRQV